MTALWTAITTVWQGIATWFISTVQSMEALFYDSTTSSLTFLGTLGVIALGISVIFLLIGFIQNFLHLRG